MEVEEELCIFDQWDGGEYRASEKTKSRAVRDCLSAEVEDGLGIFGRGEGGEHGQVKGRLKWNGQNE